MTIRAKNFLWLMISLLVIMSAIALVVIRPPSSVHAVYLSPSGNYKLVVHSYYRIVAAPGDASGSPGYVELFDTSGKKLAESKIPLVLDVSSADDIRWYEHDVSVPGAFDFPLSH